MHSAMWSSVSRRNCPTSKDPIADLEMGRLVQAWAIISDPVGDPVDHLRERYVRTAEETDGLGCIGHKSRRRFPADILRLLAKPLAKRSGQPSDGYNLGS